MTIVFSILVIPVLLFFVYLFPEFYISELILSFVPHIVFFCLAMFGLSIAMLKNKKLWIYVKFVPLFILMFGFLFFLYSREFNSFYNGEWFFYNNSQEYIVEEKDWLNILYSNILYKNQNHTGLVDWINNYDADIVLMVEFTDDHYQNMKDVLQEIYPYSARTSWSKKYFGNVVFSKYPINNLSKEIDQWTWRYTYFSTEHNKQNYYFYLIHTSSPVTYGFFEMRNNQFDILTQDFKSHMDNKIDTDKIMIIGDFNVSPWSYYYKNIEKSFVGLKNMTKNFTILFTWRLKLLSFVTSHIDHIFINENSDVSDIIRLKTPNSDHRWFFIENFK
jgi:endonuclease/exonuclease/phosphatase (EEP) superfamily protein YafD